LQSPPLTDNLRILVIADDPLARTGLTTLLTERSDFSVVGQIAGDGDLALNMSVYAPDVIVWDLGWDAATGLERLAESGDLGVPLVMLFADVASAADTYAAGARGLFLRSTEIERLIAALPAVARGLLVLDSTLGSALFAPLLAPRERPVTPPGEPLTARESQVLQSLAEGLPNKAIAQRLGISENTIKFHVNAIMTKLGAQSRTDAVVRATRSGLIIL
jgi:two-component system nitrate/nitrite response regulator NarL